VKVKEALEDNLKREVASALEEVQIILMVHNIDEAGYAELDTFIRVSELVKKCKLVGWC